MKYKVEIRREKEHIYLDLYHFGEIQKSEIEPVAFRWTRTVTEDVQTIDLGNVGNEEISLFLSLVIQEEMMYIYEEKIQTDKYCLKEDWKRYDCLYDTYVRKQFHTIQKKIKKELEEPVTFLTSVVELLEDRESISKWCSIQKINDNYRTPAMVRTGMSYLVIVVENGSEYSICNASGDYLCSYTVEDSEDQQEIERQLLRHLMNLEYKEDVQMVLIDFWVTHTCIMGICKLFALPGLAAVMNMRPYYYQRKGN